MSYEATMQAGDREQGTVIGGALVMLVLSLLLCWLPGIGTLIAGVVGGKISGGVGRALLAALLPSIALGIALFALGTLFTGMPLIGLLAGMGGAVLAATQVGTLLLGAAIGGLLA